jgi:hypothetical protein
MIDRKQFSNAMNTPNRNCVSSRMKSILHRLILAVTMAVMGVSCSTVYDQYGRPRTVVEPGAAILGAAAAGLIGYGLAGGFDGGHHHHHGHHCYY